MTITGIHHVQITIPVGAEAAGRSFYCDLLKLPEIPKPEALHGRGGFWLQVGDRAVHVGTEAGVDRQRTKAHIAYTVTNLDDWRQQLTAQAIAISESVPIPGYDRFEFRDPFGNRIELIQAI